MLVSFHCVLITVHIIAVTVSSLLLEFMGLLACCMYWYQFTHLGKSYSCNERFQKLCHFVVVLVVV